MGLDTSHDCWHGPYSSFNRWRAAIARVVGIDLRAMAGFGGAADWSVLADDPIALLLNHSDCDGTIATADCGPIADRLEACLPLLPTAGVDEYLRADTCRFISGLRAAAKAGEDVDFH